MNTPLPSTLLAVIAALRCQALPWATIAERVAVDEVTLRQQLAAQRDEFQAHMDRAKADLAEDLLFAGLAKLQQLLNCGKQNIENDAAKTLLRFHQNLHNVEKDKPATRPKETPTPNVHPEPPAKTVPTQAPKKSPEMPNGLRELLDFAPLPPQPPLFTLAPKPQGPPNTKSG